MLLAVAGCQPEIGDSWSNANDCSVQDPRTCDTTFPGGYCTIFGCGGDTCPGEAVCIGFQSVVSAAPECASLQSRPRLQRTACMLRCSQNSDCRGGYECVDMAEDNPWGALVVDQGRGTRACSLRAPAAPVGDTAICSDVETSLSAPLDAGSGADAAPPNEAGSSDAATP
jgi:hypothetical protein